MTHYLDSIRNRAAADAFAAENGHKKYGDSCLQRGGVGLFMMLARKWDRIERACQISGYDIFTALKADPEPEGLLDDIRDLRVYLLIAEAEFLRTYLCEVCLTEDGEPVPGVKCDGAAHRRA